MEVVYPHCITKWVIKIWIDCECIVNTWCLWWMQDTFLFYVFICHKSRRGLEDNKSTFVGLFGFLVFFLMRSKWSHKYKGFHFCSDTVFLSFFFNSESKSSLTEHGGWGQWFWWDWGRAEKEWLYKEGTLLLKEAYSWSKAKLFPFRKVVSFL